MDWKTLISWKIWHIVEFETPPVKKKPWTSYQIAWRRDAYKRKQLSICLESMTQGHTQIKQAMEIFWKKLQGIFEGMQ